MARTIKDARLDSRTARAKLAPGRTHWRAIDVGLALGWRCQLDAGVRVGGRWSARRYLGGGKYRIEPVGIADDSSDADGVAVLDFGQAQAAARSLFAAAVRRDKGVPGAVEPYTVAKAVDTYLEAAFRAGRKAMRTAEGAAKVHIVPKLGHIPVEDLTTDQVARWLADLARSPAQLRSSPGKPVYRAENDPRARQASANRILAVLRAALNTAWRDGKVTSDAAWRKVSAFKGAAAPVIRYLSEAEAIRLLNACEPDFRRLVAGALATAMRYGELAALRCADANLDSGTILVRISKGGRPRHVHLTDEGRRLFEGLIVGRPGDARVFLRDDGDPWGKSHQGLRLRDACKRAGIVPAIGFHVLRHTVGSQLAMKGVPLNVIAHLLGHADTRVTERHYAHLAPSYVATAIRSAGVTFGLAPDPSAPVPLPPRRLK